MTIDDKPGRAPGLGALAKATECVGTALAPPQHDHRARQTSDCVAVIGQPQLVEVLEPAQCDVPGKAAVATCFEEERRHEDGQLQERRCHRVEPSSLAPAQASMAQLRT